MLHNIYGHEALIKSRLEELHAQKSSMFVGLDRQSTRRNRRARLALTSPFAALRWLVGRLAGARA